MESYEPPADFRPPAMAEAFARVEDGRICAAAAHLLRRRPLVRQAIERGQHLPTALTILGDLDG